MIFEKDYISILNNEYLKRVKLNSSYSKRAFSKLLEISPSSLSEILNRKRNLSIKNAKKICKKLNFNKEETFEFLKIMSPEKSLEQESYNKLEVNDLDMHYIISEWYCTEILNLPYLKSFSWDVNWIAKKLNIAKVEVETALEKLEKVGLIRKVGDGYELTHQNVETSSDVPSQAIRNYHSQILKKAENSMLLHSVDEREISGISFNIDRKQIPLIKREIQEFQNFLANKYNKNPSDEIYHLETCFFKLTEEI